MDDKNTSVQAADSVWTGDQTTVEFDTNDIGNFTININDSTMSSGGSDSISTITIGGDGSGGSFYGTGPGSYNTYSINDLTFPGITNYGQDTIKTSKGKEIDLNDLADTMDAIKRRLLILTPNFEMHEKYPMLKEMYEEYLAMERLLGGPDTPTEI